MGWIFILIWGIIIFIAVKNWKKDTRPVQAPNTRPWLRRYTSLTKNFDPEYVDVLYKKICRLAKRYQPPAARSLFLQAHQFTAKHNNFYSLLLYLHYLQVKTPSAAFPHRKISDNLKKILFQNKMQETRFLQICNQLKENRNLNQAIEDTKQLFRITRREIRLDAPVIEEASREQSQTAELLGKYLEDETETMLETTAPIIVSPVNNSENDLFRLFEQNNFVLSKKEIDTFAQNKGVFRNSLIQQINERYYETVDDVLIEDEGDNYTFNRMYYEQLKECP